MAEEALGNLPDFEFLTKKTQQMMQSLDMEEDAFLLRQFGEEQSQYNKILEDTLEDSTCEQRSPVAEDGSVRVDEQFRRSTDQESFYDEEEELEEEFMKHPFNDFVVDPTGDLYYAWQGIVGISVFYNIIFTIMRIAFEQLEYYWWVFWVLDILTDIIYATDMIVQMNISYIDDGIYVTDKTQLKANYLKTKRFNYDALAIAPLPYVTFVIKLLYWVFRKFIGLTDIGLFIPVSEITLIGFCRIPRLIKYKALSEFFTSMESRTNAPDTFRAFNLIVYLLVIIHWIACVYYCISWYEGFGMNGWVYPATEEGEAEHMFLRKYTVCFYWSFLTLTTIGGSSDPETNLEYLFTGLTFFNGVFVFAAVVGNVGDVISNMNAARTEFQAKMDDIKRYMVHHKVPDTLQKRVKKWFDYSWGRTHGVDESSLLETLPDKLRARIQIQIHLKTLKKVAIFEKCENGLLCELVLKLRLQIFSPRDYVCRRNELGKEMYIINHGKLECIVTTESGERIVVATLTEGKYFGEIALLSFEGNNRRTADVRSVGYSELLVLSKKALMSALVDYPEARKQLEYQAQLRISSNRKMSSALKAESSSGSAPPKPGQGLGLRAGSKQTLPTTPQLNAKVNQACAAALTKKQTQDIIESERFRVKQAQEVDEILLELKSFDSLATRQRIRSLEETITILQNEIKTKSSECSEATSKVKALEKLHVNNTPLYNGVEKPAKLTNGGCHRERVTVTSTSNNTRTQKIKEFEERIGDISPVEDKVSDRTRKILEALRQQRLTQSSQTPQTSANTSMSRQTSFTAENQAENGQVARNSLSNSITQSVREQESPTVMKYLKNTPQQNSDSPKVDADIPENSEGLNDGQQHFAECSSTRKPQAPARTRKQNSDYSRKNSESLGHTQQNSDCVRAEDHTPKNSDSLSHAPKRDARQCLKRTNSRSSPRPHRFTVSVSELSPISDISHSRDTDSTASLLRQTAMRSDQSYDVSDVKDQIETNSKLTCNGNAIDHFENDKPPGDNDMNSDLYSPYARCDQLDPLDPYFELEESDLSDTGSGSSS